MRLVLGVILFLGASLPILAADNAPWGAAPVLDIRYRPSKVLYDLTSGDEKTLANILDRVSYLNTLYGADPFDSSIVVIVHGDAIPFFVHKHYERYRALMKRAQSLTTGTAIEFRMCRAAAKMMGYTPANVHGFVKMVPMADAEIVRLQRDEGYAYMR